MIERPGLTESPVMDIKKTQWWGVDLPSDAMPPWSTVQEILWGLYELNFHFELVALNWRMSNGAHDDLIAACFPNSDAGMTYIALANSNRGLVADDWHIRLLYIKAFINIMYTWNIHHPQAFRLADYPVQLTEDQFLELTKLLYAFILNVFLMFLEERLLSLIVLLND